MPKCADCGEEHELLDPTYHRPDAYVALNDAQRAEHAQADDDLCRIDLPGEAPRLFVRCVLPVAVAGLAQGIWWGLWAEVDEATFHRTLELWNDERQSAEPALAAHIANDVPGHQLAGLAVHMQLTGTSTRPNIVLPADSDHAFVKQCLLGVDQQQAHRWMHSMTRPAHGTVLDAPNLRSFACQHVCDGETICYIVCDSDGDWQFLCGKSHGGAGDQPRIALVADLLQQDPSLRQLGAQLRPGQCAEREHAQAAWRISGR
jgi:hypothetical protein